MSVSNISSEEDGRSVISYLCFKRKLYAIKILPAKTVCNAKVIEKLSKGVVLVC